MRTNLNLSTLERRIKTSALCTIRQIGKDIPKKSDLKYLIFAMECDGVIDLLYYDNINKKFSHVEYEVGQGEGSFLFDANAGYFNKTQKRILYL